MGSRGSTARLDSSSVLSHTAPFGLGSTSEDDWEMEVDDDHHQEEEQLQMSMSRADESDRPLRVAVVGAGVAGLGAAWHLSHCPNVEVVLLEAGDKAGGHANTIKVQPSESEGEVAVDTGFMVYNAQNYPNMEGLFAELGVEGEDSEMSFSVSLDGGAMEWGSEGLGALLATKKNVLRPAFYRMLKDLVRFNREASELLLLHTQDPRRAVTVGEFLKQHGYSPAFTKTYLVPMCAALWSSSSADIMNFSAFTMVSFMHNHSMLQLFGRPQWKTPAGRSVTYVQAILKRLRRGQGKEEEGGVEGEEGGAEEGGGGAVRLGTEVTSVERQGQDMWTVRVRRRKQGEEGEQEGEGEQESKGEEKIKRGGEGAAEGGQGQGQGQGQEEEGSGEEGSMGSEAEDLGAVPLSEEVTGVAAVSPTAAEEQQGEEGGRGGGGKEEGSPSPVDGDDDADEEDMHFDQVIFACPADVTLRLLRSSATAHEAAALGAFQFEDNTVVVHTDERLMPQSRAAWSAWNYIGTSEGIDRAESKPVFVTYWLNRLQNLKGKDGTPLTTNIFVSLNPTLAPSRDKVLREIEYRHPQFSPAADKARRQVAAMSGKRGLWFAGAWLGYGFHEDGLRTGLQAATSISGRPVPWVPQQQQQQQSVIQQEETQTGGSSPLSSSAIGATVDGVEPAPTGPSLMSSSMSSSGSGSSSSSSSRGRQHRSSLVLPQPALPTSHSGLRGGVSGLLRSAVTGLATRSVCAFLRHTISVGQLTLIYPDGRTVRFGEGMAVDGITPCREEQNIAVRVFDWWFFVRIALEYDLGLARSYIAGEWMIEGDTRYADGLRRLFLLFVDNRDTSKSNALSPAKLFTAWIGYGLNFLRYKLSMDNSIRGSRSNIEAHYDLSNDLFTTFLDTRHLMYSSAIFDASLDVAKPGRNLVFRDTLEAAQTRKIDLLIKRSRVEAHHKLLDIGFGWGGVAIRAAETIGCQVVGITLSIEQKQLAERLVREKGLEHLVTFELVDYRIFSSQHKAEFDSIISCEMIEAVGHRHLGSFFESVNTLLKPNGVFVMEAITTPESRYEEYLKSTDFINTIIFPGSCCPSLTALLEAMSKRSELSLEGYDNIGMHYAETLRMWRMRFNNSETRVRSFGFDGMFIRCWNYYFTYCEAGFHSQTEGCLILTFSRPGNERLLDSSDVLSILGHH